jgi:hypothetical protein
MADVSILTPLKPEPAPSNQDIPNSIYGMDLNYAAANSWYAFLPLENILGRRYSNLNLHLTRFSLPQMQMQSTTVSYKGVEKKIPTKVFNPGDKTLSLEYIVDENWQNYRALFAWMPGITGTINGSTQDENQSIQPSDYISLRIYLLDNYKRKVIQFVFENCWVETFNDLALEQNNSAEVTHSFSFSYDYYYIEDINRKA